MSSVLSEFSRCGMLWSLYYFPLYSKAQPIQVKWKEKKKENLWQKNEVVMRITWDEKIHNMRASKDKEMEEATWNNKVRFWDPWPLLWWLRDWGKSITSCSVLWPCSLVQFSATVTASIYVWPSYITISKKTLTHLISCHANWSTTLFPFFTITLFLSLSPHYAPFIGCKFNPTLLLSSPSARAEMKCQNPILYVLSRSP